MQGWGGTGDRLRQGRQEGIDEVGLRSGGVGSGVEMGWRGMEGGRVGLGWGGLCRGFGLVLFVLACLGVV